jgi:hypothetical protein
VKKTAKTPAKAPASARTGKSGTADKATAAGKTETPK